MAGIVHHAAPKYPALEGGSGARPRIMSDAFSPIIIVGALRFPLTIDGMMELSTTRSPSSPWTPHCESTTDIGSSPIRQVPHAW